MKKKKERKEEEKEEEDSCNMRQTKDRTTFNGKPPNKNKTGICVTCTFSFLVSRFSITELHIFGMLNQREGF